jgi:hypothetical protein
MMCMIVPIHPIPPKPYCTPGPQTPQPGSPAFSMMMLHSSPQEQHRSDYLKAFEELDKEYPGLGAWRERVFSG